VLGQEIRQGLFLQTLVFDRRLDKKEQTEWLGREGPRLRDRQWKERALKVSWRRGSDGREQVGASRIKPEYGNQQPADTTP
jgi:hypothetical protein